MSEDQKTADEAKAAAREAAKAQAVNDLRFRTLGEVMFLMSLSPIHKHQFIADLEWSVLPAIAQNQCFIFREEGRATAVCLYGYVTGEAEDRFKKGVMKLSPNEWNNGDNLWLVNMIDPYNKAGEALEALKAGPLAGKPFKFTTVNAEGQRVVALMGKEER